MLSTQLSAQEKQDVAAFLRALLRACQPNPGVRGTAQGRRSESVLGSERSGARGLCPRCSASWEQRSNHLDVVHARTPPGQGALRQSNDVCHREPRTHARAMWRRGRISGRLPLAGDRSQLQCTNLGLGSVEVGESPAPTRGAHSGAPLQGLDRCWPGTSSVPSGRASIEASSVCWRGSPRTLWVRVLRLSLRGRQCSRSGRRRSATLVAITTFGLVDQRPPVPERIVGHVTASCQATPPDRGAVRRPVIETTRTR